MRLLLGKRLMKHSWSWRANAPGLDFDEGRWLHAARRAKAHQELGYGSFTEYLDDDATLLLLARHVLGGPADDGRASYQVAIDVCEDCQRARQIRGANDIVPGAARTAFGNAS